MSRHEPSMGWEEEHRSYHRVEPSCPYCTAGGTTREDFEMSKTYYVTLELAEDWKGELSDLALAIEMGLMQRGVDATATVSETADEPVDSSADSA